MNKFLTESGWKAVAQKFKLKDTTLQQALAAYAKLEEGKYLDRVKALEHVGQVANTLKKSKEVLPHPEVEKYLAEVIKANDAEIKDVKAASVEKAVAANKKLVEDVKALTPPKPDPKMLEEVHHIGMNDALNEKPSRQALFAKAPAYQKEYDAGYKFGEAVEARIRAQGPQQPQTSMSPITEEREKQINEYTRRRASRKEFIQHLNDWWGTVLPEDM